VDAAAGIWNAATDEQRLRQQQDTGSWRTCPAAISQQQRNLSDPAVARRSSGRMSRWAQREVRLALTVAATMFSQADVPGVGDAPSGGTAGWTLMKVMTRLQWMWKQTMPGVLGASEPLITRPADEV